MRAPFTPASVIVIAVLRALRIDRTVASIVQIGSFFFLPFLKNFTTPNTLKLRLSE
jgi:hypothetical protein